jgi:MFS family permease
VLTLGCVLAFVDRSILNLFIIPIQRDLHLSDTQISLLVGFAFGVFNAIFGLPVARWVDSGRRMVVATTGIVVWSVATMSCGLATHFSQLFVGRVAVGAGEAAVTPAGVSLLADLFPAARRGAAMGVFYAGAFIGTGGALILGGILWRAIGDRLLRLPVIGPVHSWQWILMLVGSMGVLVAPLTLALREPSRKEGNKVVGPAAIPVAEVARYYARHSKTLFGHTAGFCLQNFALHAGAAWAPTLLVRTEGWSIPQAGLTFGLFMLILGPIGATISGVWADALAKRGRRDSKLVVAICAASACALTSVIIAANWGSTAVVAALAVFSFFSVFTLPLAPGALQELMPNAMRGQATAIYVGVTNLIAGGFAATAVALLTDYVFHDQAKLYLSFGLVGTAVCGLAGCILFATLKPFRATVEWRRSVHETH